MFNQISKFFIASSHLRGALQLYAELVKQARQPVFYTQYGLPDSIDGRFEMILLHLFLALRRLKAIGGREAATFSRLLSEAFFTDMDRSVREIGVSDTGVPKRVKRMAAAYFGRLQAYEEAFADSTSLQQALRRNVYATAPQEAAALDAQAAKLEAYLRQAEKSLQAQAAPELLAGRIHWPEI